MQLTTGIFWTDTHRAQVGLDPRLGISLDGLAPGEIQLVDWLTRPHTDAEVTARARATGISAPRLRSILNMLGRAGVLDPDPSPLPDAFAAKRIHGSVPDRQGYHVHIDRADYLGAGIAIGLARCGFGRITSNDCDVVSFTDHPHMRKLGIGVDRQAALKTLVRRESPHVRAGKRTSSQPDLVVVTGTYAIDPITVGQYAAEQVPVYQAWIEEVDIIVGPLTIAHETACANCLMLHREELDPNWRTLIRQACAAPAFLPEIGSAMLAISLAVRDITEAFDAGRVPHMWRVGPSPTPPEPMILEPHPSCGCTSLDRSSD
ncbi:hypothetical protein J2S70_001374 [Trueperella bonasi]|uniref:Bacteriocin biosynthesis cyclodehydratase domain-containing protein n=1 Tax=Trueperella bonasi TaxID=312286 RepID=A0ABT9NHB2_9ACTO|nr:hypothetical protein [Trueperella bonasi]MDP9806792.1 hypothetical protein [Trueperella bonasi]